MLDNEEKNHARCRGRRRTRNTEVKRIRKADGGLPGRGLLKGGSGVEKRAAIS